MQTGLSIWYVNPKRVALSCFLLVFIHLNIESKMFNNNSIDGISEDMKNLMKKSSQGNDNDMSTDDEQNYDGQDNHEKSKLQKIYLNEQNKKARGKRRSFTLDKKLEAIKMVKSGMTKVQVAKLMNVNRRNLIQWCQNENKIEEHRNNLASERRGRARLMRKVYYVRPQWPEMETELYNWIVEERVKQNPVSRRMISKKAIELYAKHYQFSGNKVTNGWFNRFKIRNKLSNRIRTGNGQKIPFNAHLLVNSFFNYNKKTINLNKIETSSIASMDEVPCYFDMSSNKTYESTGTRNILVRSSGNEKTRFTVLLCAFANGNKMIPTIIFKNLTKPPKECNGIKGAYIEAAKGGSVNEEQMLNWTKNVWFKNIQVNFKKTLLMFDSHRAHTVESVKQLFKNSKTSINVIPGGCTPLLQPGDVVYHRMFKHRLKEYHEEWICSHSENEKIKRPTYKQVADWVIKAWDQISKNDIKTAFEICGVADANYPQKYHYLLKTIMEKNLGTVFVEDDMIGEVYEHTGITDDEESDEQDEPQDSPSQNGKILVSDDDNDDNDDDDDDIGAFAFGSQDTNSSSGHSKTRFEIEID